MNNVYVGNNNNSQAKGHGITFCGALAIAFIVLKLCGVKIIKTFVSDEKKTPEEIAELERVMRDDHMKLHEKAKKYHQLKTRVREMAQITGDIEI